MSQIRITNPFEAVDFVRGIKHKESTLGDIIEAQHEKRNNSLLTSLNSKDTPDSLKAIIGGGITKTAGWKATSTGTSWRVYRFNRNVNGVETYDSFILNPIQQKLSALNAISCGYIMMLNGKGGDDPIINTGKLQMKYDHEGDESTLNLNECQLTIR